MLYILLFLFPRPSQKQKELHMHGFVNCLLWNMSIFPWFSTCQCPRQQCRFVSVVMFLIISLRAWYISDILGPNKYTTSIYPAIIKLFYDLVLSPNIKRPATCGWCWFSLFRFSSRHNTDISEIVLSLA